MPRAATAGAALVLAAAIAGSGCHVDITRVREGEPLDLESFGALEPGTTTLGEALDALGAPDRVEWKAGRDYLAYRHLDFTRVGFRLQSPISVFGYRHTVAELEGSNDDANEIALVFKDGVLERKSSRLSPAYRLVENGGVSGRGVEILPRYAVIPLLAGDGGEASFADLFGLGHAVGLDIGLRPAGFFLVTLGASYQRLEGDGVRDRGRSVRLDDLELYQVELGGRLYVPPRFFASFWKIDELRELFHTEEVLRHRGTFLYLRWGLGGTYANSVEVEIDGVPNGTYFDHSLVFSTAIGLGLEYSAGPVGAYAEVVYQSIGALAEGTVRGLDTSGGSLQSFLAGGGISVSF